MNIELITDWFGVGCTGRKTQLSFIYSINFIEATLQPVVSPFIVVMDRQSKSVVNEGVNLCMIFTGNGMC